MKLFNENLINQYTKVHEKTYGNTSERLLYLLLPMVKELQPQSILDYGCGQSNLVELIKKELDSNNEKNIKTYKYDPAIESISSLPDEKVDLVINTDVLEHIPLDDLPDVIKKITILGKNTIFVICNRKAKLILEDGSNAHCSVYPREWWLNLIKEQTGFAKLVSLPVRATCCIATWDTHAIGGKLDSVIKYLAGNLNKYLK